MRITIKEPSVWWHWPFYLSSVALFVVFLAVCGAVSTPYLAMYPEHAPHRYDRGTPRQREIIKRYRRKLSRAPLLVRVSRGAIGVIRVMIDVVRLPFAYLRNSTYALFSP